MSFFTEFKKSYFDFPKRYRKQFFITSPVLSVLNITIALFLDGTGYETSFFILGCSFLFCFLIYAYLIIRWFPYYQNCYGKRTEAFSRFCCIVGDWSKIRSTSAFCDKGCEQCAIATVPMKQKNCMFYGKTMFFIEEQRSYSFSWRK